jgi:hypothetical protein
MDATRPTAWARIARVMAVPLALAAGATSVAARGDRAPHPPIFVPTPTVGSPITPISIRGSRYCYHSPGPVYYHLHYWGPHYGCRLWRYNYLYWICG